MKSKKTQNMHSPTLNTILMIEAVLEDNDGKYITIPQLKKQLIKQVNHNTLMQVLAYLEESNKISVSLKGITWTHKLSRKLSRT